MKPKKSKKANLENKRFLFFQIGLIASMALALLAFEWGSKESGKVIIGKPIENWGIGDPLPPVTRQTEAPKIKPLEIYELVIKDNDDDIVGKMLASTDIDPWEKVDYAQYRDIDEKPLDDIPFRICEDMPSFRNGDLGEFVRYIQSIVVYPEPALEMNIQGKVYADFVVNKEGYVENIRIIRGVDPLLDNEVIKALKASPRWKPGSQRGIPVKVAYTIPINFKIN